MILRRKDRSRLKAAADTQNKKTDKDWQKRLYRRKEEKIDRRSWTDDDSSRQIGEELAEEGRQTKTNENKNMQKTKDDRILGQT